MNELILYHAVPSRGLVVHWMLEELGVPYKIVNLDMDAEAHKKPEYLAINPMGQVPALKHGGRIITETAAICMYLAEQFPQKNLSIPLDSPVRHEYLRWIFYSPVTIEPALAAKMVGFKSEEYQPFADLELIANTLVELLKNRKYVVGDRFTAADVIVGSAINWGLNLVPVLPRRPELLAYWSNLEEREAWKIVASTLE